MGDEGESAHCRAQRRYIARRKQTGAVQAAVWVPNEHHQDMLRLAALLRERPDMPFPRYVPVQAGRCFVNVFECSGKELEAYGVIPPGNRLTAHRRK